MRDPHGLIVQIKIGQLGGKVIDGFVRSGCGDRVVLQELEGLIDQLWVDRFVILIVLRQCRSGYSPFDFIPERPGNKAMERIKDSISCSSVQREPPVPPCGPTALW